MSRRLKYLLGIITAIVILAVGYLVYQNQVSVSVKLTPEMFSNIINQKPTASSTQTERGAYMSLVNKNAVPSSTIEISACAATPPIISVMKGASFVISNKDTISHTISFSPSDSFVIATSSSATIKTTDFGKMAGVYPFRCDLSTSTSGIVMVK